MSIRNRLTLITVLLSTVIGVFTALYIRYNLPSENAAVAEHALIGTLRPDFNLNDLNAHSTPISTWDGKIVLLNFWASWCAPCRHEIPAFNEVRKLFYNSGFEVVGIAIDEKEKVLSFLESIPDIQYPQLIGYNDAMKIASSFGNHSGRLPYSVLLDQYGVIRYIKLGELDKQTLITRIQQLLS